MICWPSAQLEAAKRMYLHLHDELQYHDGTFTHFTEKPTQMTPFHFTDGVSIHLAESDIDPGDDFTTNPAAKPASLRG